MTSKVLECGIRALLSAVVVFVCSDSGTAQHVRKKKAPSQYRLKAPPVRSSALGCVNYFEVGFIPDEKALSKPAPLYPEEVRAKRISGTVVVQVVIDPTGKVISAEALIGPTRLRQAAVDAAYRAKFLATKLSGQPVKIMGQLEYSFRL